MSSPLKLASTLISKKIKSPISPKFLSPHHERNNEISSRQNLLSCGYQLYVPKSYEEIDVKSNKIQIKINEYQEDDIKEGFTINSPNKLSLLKHGLNKQSLLYAIGKGTFGTVIKGKYNGDVVAVKIIKSDKPQHKINEYNAYNLSHQNIIRIIDIVCNNSEKYGLIIMEYYENSRNLQEVLDDLSFILDKNKIIKMSMQIVSGVKYCHENGVLHLDIKPKNILVCNNQCKICDFGNSVRESEATPLYNYRGTVAYTAPEILKGEKPTVKCDIYSLGILLWQMISRKFPYESMDNEVVIYKVVKFKLRPSTSSLKHMEKISKLCFDCWEENAGNRPLSSEILSVLMFLA